MSACHGVLIDWFQFQTGSIKRTLMLIFTLTETGFNSKLVRLKVDHNYDYASEKGFNSKLVRLKGDRSNPK